MRRRLPLTLFLLAAFALTSVAVSSATSGPATFSQTPIHLGSAQSGNHPSTTVTVTNTGDTAMTIGAAAFSFTGTNPGAFGTSSDGCSNSTVPSGGTCQVDVSLTANSAGSYDATLNLASDAPSSPDQVGVDGTITPAPQPAISITPISFDFGNQKVGTTSPGQQFQITNSGDGTLHIATVSPAAGSDAAFSVSSNCNGATAPCTVTATFAPGTAGPLTGGLSVTSSDDGVQPAAATLTGTGAVPDASVPATVAFATPVNVAKVVPVTLTNNGNAALNVNGVALSGGNGAFTNPQTGNCGHAVLAPGGSCQSQIQFKPSSVGTYNATLTFTDDDGAVAGSQQQVGLVGTVQIPGIQASPTTVQFGTVVEGRRSDPTAVTITNTGDANLHIANVKIGGVNTGSFLLGADTCTDGAIAPQDTCRAIVRFAPAKPTGRTATLVFVNDAGPDQSIPLTGAGARPPDGSNLRFSAGCSDAKLSWRNPNALRFKKVVVVRGRRHYPKSPRDGTLVRHTGSSVVDRGPDPLRTYRYTLFAKYGSFDGERNFYSAGMHAKVHTGRICTPRNGAVIRDLTPTVDWLKYSGARSYAFILQRGGRTIWVHYVRRSRFHIPATWRYAGASRSVTHHASYAFFLYAYTRHKPNGVTIGQSAWTER